MTIRLAPEDAQGAAWTPFGLQVRDPVREEALAADLLVTVTPGREVLLAEGSLAPGQHASLMGADGPGKQEIAVEELAGSAVSGVMTPRACGARDSWPRRPVC